MECSHMDALRILVLNKISRSTGTQIFQIILSQRDFAGNKSLIRKW